MAHILLAEDDTSTRQFLAAAIAKAGHDVIACADGLEAAQELATALAKGKAFDLLLTDIVMPGMDGIELSARARKVMPAIKVMMITGFAAMAANDSSTQAPAKIISKPFHLGAVISEIEKTLKA